MTSINKFQSLTLIFSIFFVMTSCAQESKQKNENTNKPAKTFGKGASAIEKIRALNKETSALKSLEPLKVKELENWLPETIKGMHKTKGGALTQDGIIGINASYLKEHPEYGKDFGTTVSILIIDGHGEKGAVAAGSFVSIKYDNINSDKSNGYTKTIMYEDTVVKEEYTKHNKLYTLSFFYDNRFAVEMKLKGFEQNELWEVFKAFKLNELTN